MEFRFENRLDKLLYLFSRQRKKSINAIIQEAIEFCIRQHEAGTLVFEKKSDFLARKDKNDKEITTITIKRRHREMTRALAYAYDCSRAEVMRIALEVYFTYLKKVESNNQKNYYSIPQFRIERVEISFLKPYIHKTVYTNPIFRDTS